MSPEQCLKHMILRKRAAWRQEDTVEITAENIDALYDAADEADDGDLQDARNEVRCSGVDTHLPCAWMQGASRNYESKAVAAQAPDGRWVGWTEWYGGGKHSEPSAIPWMEHAYFVDCAEVQQMVTVRAFSLPAAAGA